MEINNIEEANERYKEALELFKTDKNKAEEIFKNLAKYYKIAADEGDSYAMNIYANMLYDGKGIRKNKRKAVIFYRMAIDGGNIDAINNYANMLYYGDGIEENKKEAIEYYKISADKGNIDAINNYANILINDNNVEINKEEAIKYYKKAVNSNNFNFILNKNPNKEIFNRLLKEYIEKIYYEKKEDENFEFDKKNRIKKIRNLNYNQGKNQVIIDREFEYSIIGNISKIKDVAYHKNTKNILYEVEYNNNEKIITYFDKNGNILFSAKILKENTENNGKIEFDFGNNLSKDKIKEIKKKILEILNSFENIDSFDYDLSYLEYSILKLELKKKIYNNITNNIIIKTNCINSIDNLLNVANDSLKVKNKDKIFICDFATNGHNTQMIIYNGIMLISNTGKSFNYLIEGIKKNFDEKYPDNKEKLKISELSFLGQEKKNCVQSSKIQTINFILIFIKYLLDEKTKEQNKNENIIANLSECLNNSIEFLEQNKKTIESFEDLTEKNLFLLKITLKLRYNLFKNHEKACLIMDMRLYIIEDKIYEILKNSEIDKNKKEEINKKIEEIGSRKNELEKIKEKIKFIDFLIKIIGSNKFSDENKIINKI